MMSTPNISRLARAVRLRWRVVLALTAVAAALTPLAAAHAEWYISRDGAQRMAKDYVSKHYADTYTYNLTTVCKPQGRPYDPRYTFHRWKCVWYDRSDRTAGIVVIIGSARTGGYYGYVLRGARSV